MDKKWHLWKRNSKNYVTKARKGLRKVSIENWLFGFLGLFILFIGASIIWASTLKLPDYKTFSERRVLSSTQIYDRTGTHLLYDVHGAVKRTVIPYEAMGINIKNATVAIEDSEFWQHKGIRVSSIIRGTVWAVLTGKKIQGGSTITQQLVKNTLLTQDRTLTRKIKEWILALKVEKAMTKEEILALYLNEAPYGGSIYGIEEASKQFFGKDPANLTLAESAYLAAIPNAPTHYSPYGKNRAGLEERKNLVLKRMLDLKFITQQEYNTATREVVAFQPQAPLQITAPHFVFFVKDYLEKKYGPDALDSGLKVVTTLDYDLEQKAEEIALTKGRENEKSFNAKNDAIVVIDPKTGQILTMVGSRDYLDKSVDGNFNVATAARQPGSSFKPIVYAEAFSKGYTEDTTLFDVPTEFNSSCSPSHKPLPGHASAKCYAPKNVKDIYYGPVTLKNALAKSLNVVAVKLLYLVGVPDALKMAHDLGITTLNDPTRYGLSLVIGGGETTLLDMTSAYSVFATDGIRHPYQSIMSIEDSDGHILEQYDDHSYQVLDSNITRQLSDILSDNQARLGTFAAGSALEVPGRQVAVKTGTTNNNRDAWTIGYTPSVVVGVWVGNNDNKVMKAGGVSLAGPIWNAVISEVLKNQPVEYFDQPDPIDQSLPPILRGVWQGQTTDSSGLPVSLVHTILYWIDKANPTGGQPDNPEKDPLYSNWEYGVQKWWAANGDLYTNQPITTGNPNAKPTFQIMGLSSDPYTKEQAINFSIVPTSLNPISKIDVFVGNTLVDSLSSAPYSVLLKQDEISGLGANNTVRVVGYDSMGNSGEASASFTLSNN
jgi:penicillin-binding protein 1C